jgi:hypothetical protein
VFALTASATSKPAAATENVPKLARFWPAVEKKSGQKQHKEQAERERNRYRNPESAPRPNDAPRSWAF